MFHIPKCSSDSFGQLPRDHKKTLETVNETFAEVQFGYREGDDHDRV